MDYRQLEKELGMLFESTEVLEPKRVRKWIQYINNNPDSLGPVREIEILEVFHTAGEKYEEINESFRAMAKDLDRQTISDDKICREIVKQHLGGDAYERKGRLIEAVEDLGKIGIACDADVGELAYLNEDEIIQTVLYHTAEWMKNGNGEEMVSIHRLLGEIIKKGVNVPEYWSCYSEEDRKNTAKTMTAMMYVYGKKNGWNEDVCNPETLAELSATMIEIYGIFEQGVEYDRYEGWKKVAMNVMVPASTMAGLGIFIGLMFLGVALLGTADGIDFMLLICASMPVLATVIEKATEKLTDYIEERQTVSLKSDDFVLEAGKKDIVEIEDEKWEENLFEDENEDEDIFE